MNYEERVVCFIDILGFRRMIEETVKGSDDLPDKIEDLAQALNLMNYLLDNSDERLETSYRVTQFSDSVVISFHSTEPGQRLFIMCSLLWVFINLINRGILIRGGVAHGKIVHTSQVVFGPAMNEAYRLESEVAVNPRVVVSPNVISSIVNVEGDSWERESEQKLINSCLSKDSDGVYYVDYICKAQSELDDPELDYPIYLNNLRNLVQSGLNSSEHAIRTKYEWLNNKLQPHLKSMRDWAVKNVEDPDLREAYKSLANG